MTCTDINYSGKDNFAADRAVAGKLMAAAPLTVQVIRENRQFLTRATSWAAQPGAGRPEPLPPRDGQVIVGVGRVG